MELKIRRTHLVDVLLAKWDEDGVVSVEALRLLLQVLGRSNTEILIDEIPDVGLRECVIDVAVRIYHETEE